MIKPTYLNPNWAEIIGEMFLKNIFILLFCLHFNFFYAQEEHPDFYILADRAIEKLYQNPDDCISYSQGLLNSDDDIEHGVILKNIIGQAYAMKGDFVQSVNTTPPSDFNNNKNYFFAHIYNQYMLADKYQNLNLYDQSDKIINRLLTQKSLNKKDYQTGIILAKLYQLKAINYSIKKNYSLALENLTTSNSFLSFKSKENEIIQLENRIFKSSFLFKNSDIENANISIDETLKILDHNKNYPFLKALACENKSKYYFYKGDFQASINYLEKGLSYLGNAPYKVLKNKIYLALSKNYLASNQDEKYHLYNKLYNENRISIDYSVKEGIRFVVKQVENSEEKLVENEEKKLNKRLLWISSVFMLIITSCLIYYILLKNRTRDLNKQLLFLKNQKLREQNLLIINKELEKNKEIKKQNISVENNDELKSEKEQQKISKEKEDEILRKLESWEQTHEYLNKNMSLAMLSTQMEVNSKYLSEVIKNKSKNFNSYINELRINRIAFLLKNEPTFLNYKVSYLAEYCGFSSHSAFTTVFKSVTGMSPNVYIQEISKNKKS